MPDQLLSRSLVIEMRFHPEGRDDISPNDPRIIEVCRRIREWAPTFQRPPVCEIPFVGRDRDNFRPLIEIADTLGYGATARTAALAIHSPTGDLVKPLLFNICNQVFEQGAINGVWTPELLDALHQLPNAHWDEFRGLDGSKDPHKLTRAELYDLLGELDPPITSRSVQKVVGGNGERKSNKGFYWTQFEPHWRALFAGTPAQASKIIRLTRHKKSQAGDTD